MQIEKYVLKVVPLRFRGADLNFELSHALFSSFDIDVGSRLLLKLVGKHVEPAAVSRIIDIGSGVGVLGIACARGYPGSSVAFRDRDALALAFTARNARLNKVRPAALEHALFLDGLAGSSFDLVLCNVPAKAGVPALDRFCRDLPGLLDEKGTAAVVVVNTIAEAARQSIIAGGGDIWMAEEASGHTALLFRQAAAPGLDRDSASTDADAWTVRERSEAMTKLGSARYRFKGYWGLPEFDTPSFATVLAAELAESLFTGGQIRRVAVINPGPGRLACFIRSRSRSRIDLCGRDALALAASERNLDLNWPGDAGREGDVSGIGEGSGQGAGGGRLVVVSAEDLPDSVYDLVVEFADLTPRVDTAIDMWTGAQRLLKDGGCYISVMPSTAFDRFERRKPKGLAKLREKKKKGWACGLWRRE
ncbi:MAG: methyltransferase [Clostridia bacterium]